MMLTSSFPFLLLVALVADSDWLTGEDVSDVELNLLTHLTQISTLPWILLQLPARTGSCES